MTTTNTGRDAALSAVGLSKRFGEVISNDTVDVSFYRGEIHAVVGESGARKTTLIRTLSGYSSPDARHLKRDGHVVAFGSPRDAARAGIGMAHQRFSVVPGISALDNLLLSAAAGRNARLIATSDRGRAIEYRLAEGFENPAVTRVAELSVEEVQRCEIAKLMYNGADVLILAEVEAYADRVSVMRAGRAVLSSILPRFRAELLQAMCGDRLASSAVPRSRTERHPVPEALVMRGLAVDDAHRGRRVSDVDLTVRAGQVVALIGVDGSGQSSSRRCRSGPTTTSRPVERQARAGTGCRAHERSLRTRHAHRLFHRGGADGNWTSEPSAPPGTRLCPAWTSSGTTGAADKVDLAAVRRRPDHPVTREDAR